MTPWEKFSKEYEPFGIQIPEEVGKIRLKTREGELTAEPGDYLMVDSEGYLYPIAEQELETVYNRVPGWRDSDQDKEDYE